MRGGAEGNTAREGKASSNAASRVKIYCRMVQRIEQHIQLDENLKSKKILLLCRSLKITQ